MTAHVSVNGELRVHGREVEIIVKPGWSTEDLVAAVALVGAPVRITIEPADAPEQAVEAPPAHGSPLDYLTELKGLISAAQSELHCGGTAEQLDRALSRCLTLANSASLGILAERKAKP